ncbi:MAG: hypothetical protein LBJ71_01995, partial [Holosporaceae bacterium]|nr:hypothetical protein [Holosporaceae bacterium]
MKKIKVLKLIFASAVMVVGGDVCADPFGFLEFKENPLLQKFSKVINEIGNHIYDNHFSQEASDKAWRQWQRGELNREVKSVVTGTNLPSGAEIVRRTMNCIKGWKKFSEEGSIRSYTSKNCVTLDDILLYTDELEGLYVKYYTKWETETYRLNLSDGKFHYNGHEYGLYDFPLTFILNVNKQT